MRYASICVLVVVAMLMGVAVTGCVTPQGTYTVDTIQALQILSLMQQAIQIAQDQGLLPQPGEAITPTQIDYKQRLLDMLFAAIERNINSIDLSDLVQKAKT